jgi:hypothetical protein
MLDVDSWANGCYALRSGENYLTREGNSYAFSQSQLAAASRFYMKASDIGTYLLYDEDAGYLVSEDGPLIRQETLQSDILLVDDDYISGAEWILETALSDWEKYALRNRRNDQLLTPDGLSDDPSEAAPVSFEATDGCAEHPELSLDATGEVSKTTFDDGDLYGIVDTHSHILSNFGFGGGGVFHGGAFHRLGVEHALPDCSTYHGEMGRKDMFGYAYDTAGNSGIDFSAIIPDLIAGELSEDNHITDGYPDFTEWPNARKRATHQQQYYRWLERAWMSGLRLVVQHATTNRVICDLTIGGEFQPGRYDCSDMTAVDRIIEESYNMERYIDAQAGGPGEGFFRIVSTPAEARAVIEDGKMAVLLGIEASDLFRCTLTQKEGNPICDEAYVRETLDDYYERGVRVLFPAHKYDNAFTPGDGDRAFIELGNFFNTGHWNNFSLECPADDSMPHGFDNGDIAFGGLAMERDEYLSEAPHDFSNFPDEPIGTAFPFISEINAPAIEGNFCQNATITPLGETLLEEMMLRGMIIEVDHLPQWSYQRAYEILEENDYPAAGTHGRHWDGRIYDLGGVSKTGFGRCQDVNNPGSSVQGFKDRIALIESHGAYPAEGFGFDLNGFAGARGPRFGPEGCGPEQENPITYPFSSVAGDVEFTEPMVGNRTIDFNTEGMIHIGLLPELLQDARADAQSDEDIEPIFRSAEGYIRAARPRERYQVVEPSPHSKTRSRRRGARAPIATPSPTSSIRRLVSARRTRRSQSRSRRRA